jgi:hypothetical protein
MCSWRSTSACGLASPFWRLGLRFFGAGSSTSGASFSAISSAGGLISLAAASFSSTSASASAARCFFLLPVPLFLSHFRFFAYDVSTRWHPAKCGVFQPASCVAGPFDAGFGGGTLVNWIFALPIALAIGLVLVNVLAGGEVAWFLDQLVVACILAFGIVRAFFA